MSAEFFDFFKNLMLGLSLFTLALILLYLFLPTQMEAERKTP